MNAFRCILVIVIICSISSSISALPNINELFSSLWAKVNDEATVNEEVIDRERAKRQLYTSDIGDSSTIPHIAETPKLPTNNDGSIDLRRIPTLSNGRIGFTPYSGSVFINGIYNGVKGESHRAEIPCYISSRLEFGTDDQERQWRVIRTYRLDAKTGVYTEEIDSDYLFIQHRMYAHQKYTRLIVSDVFAKAKRNQATIGGTFYLRHYVNSTPRLADFYGFQTKSYMTDNMATGQTLSTEHSGVETQGVTAYWTPPVETFSVKKEGESMNKTFIMALDFDGGNAKSEFDAAADILFRRDGSSMKLLKEHEDAWQKTWDMGKLEVEGENLVLKKIVEFSQYYLLSNVPSYFEYIPRARTDFLYGVARSSLGKGAKGMDQQGHIFWDNEMYIIPAMLPMHPDKVRDILRYRAEMYEAALEEAKLRNEQGARYPWESAFSGRDVTPAGTCEGCRDRQIHVGADIAYAVRIYLSMTEDKSYLTDPEYKSCNMIKSIADFYASKAIYDPEDGRYHIKDVMGPDDYHDHQDNDAYTNAVVSLALHFARYMACLCNRPIRQEIPDEYVQKALLIKLPFDNVKKVHYQSDTYREILLSGSPNKTIKQASAIMLGYPLNFNMSSEIQKNDLEFYEQLITPRSPAMTQSFMTIGWKFINDKPKARAAFEESYENYVSQPFKIWSEYQLAALDPDEQSTTNFLPGMGGLLQSLIYGFAGLRIRPQMIEFHNPIPPDRLNYIKLNRFHYLGTRMTLTIHHEPRRVEIEVHETDVTNKLVVVRNSTGGQRGAPESLTAGAIITIEDPSKGFFIYSISGFSCDHPLDYVYMPWGYSPFINHAPVVIMHPYTVLFAITVHITSLYLFGVSTAKG